MGYNTYKKKGVEYAKPRVMCNNKVHCKSGSAVYDEVVDRICDSLEDIIEDFEVRVENQQDDSIKLHKNLVQRLEKQLADLEIREKLQWEAKHHPDPEERMPNHIFKELNAKILQEKEEINDALCKAKESIPDPIDYKELAVKFSDTLVKIKDPDVPATIKNMHLKEVIEKIEYFRPPTIRITHKNKKELGYEKIPKGKLFHQEPFEIWITIK